MSSNHQIFSDKTSDPLKDSYLSLGLRCFVKEARQCLTKMEGCCQNNSTERSKMLTALTNEIKKSVQLFFFTHLKSENEPSPTEVVVREAPTSSKAEQEFSRYAESQEMNFVKRTNKRLKKANLKLKKKIRNLKVNLSQAQSNLTKCLELSGKNVSSRTTERKTRQVDQPPVIPKVEKELVMVHNGPNHQENPEGSEAATLSHLPSNSAKKMTNKAVQVTQPEKDGIEVEEANSSRNQLTSRVENLNRSYQNSCREVINEVTFVVDEVKNERQQGIIGGLWTFLAMKNHSSYLIGTKERGIKLIENHHLLYFGRLPSEKKWLSDMIYVPHTDCYLVYHNQLIFRKDINNQPLYPFLNCTAGWRVGACFRYSPVHRRVIFAKDLHNISTLNVERVRVEIQVRKTVGDFIRDFKVFRGNQDRVIAVTNNGHALYYKLDFRNSQGQVMNYLSLDLMKERNQVGTSVTVCNKNQFIFVELGQSQ